MPDILPQIAPQAVRTPEPTPAPATPAAPQQANKAARADRDTESQADSFADAYEAAGEDERVETDAVTARAEEDAKVPLPIGAPDLVRTALVSDGVVEPADDASPKRARQTNEGQQLQLSLRPAQPASVDQTVAADDGPAQSIQKTEATKIVAPTAGDAEIPASVKVEPGEVKRAPQTMAPPELIRAQQPQQRMSTPTPATPPINLDASKTPIVNLDATQQAELEIESPLPERVGLRDAPSTPAARPPQAPNFAAQPQLFQTTDSAEKVVMANDELTTLMTQGTSQAQAVSPTSPGAAPTQIAQHAAGQIVAALPRDNGVFITDAGAEIALDPPELGRVRMIVTEVAGGLALTITAERPETLDLFRRNAQLLAEEFAREGLADTNFAFEGEGDGNEASPRDGEVATRVAADTQDLIDTIAPQSAAQGGLDLRL